MKKHKSEIIFASLLFVCFLFGAIFAFGQVADSISVTTKHTTAFVEISHSLTPMGWVLLFLGWLMYWLKKLKEMQITEKGNDAWFSKFIKENIIESIISVVSCLALAIFSKEIPAELMDTQGLVSVFLIGYGSSSILNSIITQAKTKI